MTRALALIAALAIGLYAGAAWMLVCQANACAALGADVCAERAGR